MTKEKDPIISGAQIRLWATVIGILVLLAGMVSWSANVNAKIAQNEKDILDLKIIAYNNQQAIASEKIENTKIQAKLDYIAENVDRINTKLEK